MVATCSKCLETGRFNILRLVVRARVLAFCLESKVPVAEDAAVGQRSGEELCPSAGGHRRCRSGDLREHPKTPSSSQI